MGKPEITKGLVTKFLPFTFLMSVIIFSNWWSRILPQIRGVDILDFLTFVIIFAVGIVVVAEGFTHKGTKNELTGAIAGAVVLWVIGGTSMIVGILQLFNLIDIYTGSGEWFAILNFVLIIDAVLLLAMTLWEVALSRKLLIHAPHKAP